jgi:transcriptional regulator with XRE-family HTH domain
VSDSFGIRLRKAREQKGLTQVALAESLRVSQSAIAQWESGRRSPAPALALRIEKLLEIALAPAEDEERTLSRRPFGRRSRLPVIGSPVPGDEERILVDEIPRGEILAPPQLEGVKGARAVYVRGRAMEPRYYTGEARLPNPGDFVFIVVRESGFPAAVGYVRRFVGEDIVSIRVSTLNPEREELVPRESVVDIATHPCLICGRCPADAHHIRFAQRSALGRRVSDELTVPLCRGPPSARHHRALHRAGDEAKWLRAAGIDPMTSARGSMGSDPGRTGRRVLDHSSFRANPRGEPWRSEASGPARCTATEGGRCVQELWTW